MELQLPPGSDGFVSVGRRDSNFSETDFTNEEFDQMERSSYTNLTNATIFQEIRDQTEDNVRRASLCTLPSEPSEQNEDEYGTKTSDNFTSISFGIQQRAYYEHNKKNTDIIGIAYNGRMRQFIILDGKGITIWKKDLLEQNVFRTLLYPKFEYRLITSLVYAKKHNVYFALGKDFSLKVLNRDFEETCRVASDLRSVLFMIFNPVRDELITGGVGGTKIWKYHQVSDKTWSEIKPMANYRLQLKSELPNVGGSWVKRVELDLNKQHLYCCSDTDLFAYNMDGQELFRFERAHNMSITGCAFSTESNLLVTASVDTEVKAWSLGGGLVHTFRGHSRAVCGLVLHPNTSALALTSSLDGSVRMWSLNTMECLYSIVISTEGLLWMGLTDDNLLYVGTLRSISVWYLNRFATFWAPARGRLTELRLISGQKKSTRVLAVCQDNSLRIFSRKTCKNLSTVLPPPSLSPLDTLLEISYNRIVNIVHVLINTREILLYTVRTDPACMVTVWDVLEIQNEIIQNEQNIVAETSVSRKRSTTSSFNKRALTRATQYGQGNEIVCQCYSICYLNGYVMMYTEEGPCTPLQDNYLLMGLEDGRILFMDPVVRAKKYFQFRANKEAIVHMKHDKEHGCLWTQCNLGDAMLIQIWLLPQLELRHEVYCPPDVTGSVRLGTSFITSHKNGAVMLHHLQDVDDMGLSVYRPRFCVNDVSSQSSFAGSTKPDHNGPVFSIDACHKLALFCTASEDGTIKIWESSKTLLTEINLDSSLCSALFLNDCGDLLVGFKNHIFHIDHSKVCPSVKVEDYIDEDYPESDIQEDPAILYEGVAENPDPLNLNNYLVPFNIDFCQDYLEGKKNVISKEQNIIEDLSDESSSLASAAPTDIYESPYSTPKSLSLVDLMLSSEVTKNDLRAHMYKDKPDKTDAPFGDEFRQIEEDSKGANELDYEMPKFGISPGPSPSPSPPSSIATPSNFDVSSGGESTPCDSEEDEDNRAFKPIDPASGSTHPQKVVAPKPAAPEEVSLKPKSRLNLIRIDTKSLLLEGHKTVARTDTEPMKAISEDTVKAKPRPPTRELKRKDISSSRKRPPARKAKQMSVQSGDEGDDDTDDGDDDGTAKTKLRSGQVTGSIKKRSKVTHEPTGKARSSDKTSPAADLMSASSSSSAQRSNKTSAQKSDSDRTTLDIPKVNAPVGELASSQSVDSGSLQKSVAGQAPDDWPRSVDSGSASLRRDSGSDGRRLFDPDGMRAAGGRASPLGRGAARDTSEDTPQTCPGDRRHTTDTVTHSDPGQTHEDVVERPKSILKYRNSTPAAIDKTNAGLSQLKVGFEDKPQSDDQADSDTIQRCSLLSLGVGQSDSTNGSCPSRTSATKADPVVRLTSHSDVTMADVQKAGVSADGRPKSQQDRAGTPSTVILSDYGSEWTLPADDQIHIGDKNTDGTSVRRWSAMSAVSGRRHQALPTESPRPRPHTALVLPADKEELERMYLKALQQYEAEGNPDQIYRNDGTTFENYHNKLIERHQLLRMQRQLRLKSAEERRRQMSLSKKERNEQILNRCPSSLGRGKPCPESAFALYDRSASSSPSHMPKVPSVYISTRLSAEPQKHSAASGNQYCSYHKEMMRGTSPSAFSGTSAGNVEKPSSGSTQKQMKSLLKSERPFRARLHPEKTVPEKKSTEKVDIRLLDPRNPAAMKQHSSQSIPSKCTRYVLVTNSKDDTNKIIPTPLEEQLIMERFPDRMEKWLTGYPRSPRTYHGFPSSYLKAMALDRKALLQGIAKTSNKAC